MTVLWSSGFKRKQCGAVFSEVKNELNIKIKLNVMWKNFTVLSPASAILGIRLVIIRIKGFNINLGFISVVYTKYPLFYII